MSIDRYVVALRAHLTASPARAAELSEEVRGHLEDAARDLQMAGLSPLESELEAVRRFGLPEEIAAALAPMRNAPRRPTRLTVTLLAAAALTIALGGSAVASAYVVPQHGGTSSTIVVRMYHAPAAPGLIQKGDR